VEYAADENLGRIHLGGSYRKKGKTLVETLRLMTTQNNLTILDNQKKLCSTSPFYRKLVEQKKLKRIRHHVGLRES
jgi:hypothetical protein